MKFENSAVDKDKNFYIENSRCHTCANEDICKFTKRYTAIQKNLIKAIESSTKNEVESKLFYNARLECLYYQQFGYKMFPDKK